MRETAAIRIDARRRYIRPLKLSIAASVLGESVIFVVWGVLLYPGGELLHKLLWTVLFCGVGMGAALGALLVLFVVDRLEGAAAVLVTAGLSAGVLGVACNLLCLQLDRHFHYFGGADNAPLFLVNGVLMASLGGAVVGWLCFTPRGRRVGARGAEETA
jgi:hypothetical protein